MRAYRIKNSPSPLCYLRHKPATRKRLPSHSPSCPNKISLPFPRSVPEDATLTSKETPQRNVQQSVAISPGNHTPPVIVQAKLVQPWGGWMGSIIFTFLITVASVASTVTTFLFLMKPTLKSIEEACQATEKSAKQLEIAAVELEEAAIMFDENLPPTLKSVESASKEFEELGQNLNSLSGGLLSRRPRRQQNRKRDRDEKDISRDETKSEESSESLQLNKEEEHRSNITKQTIDSLGRIASDISHFTQNFIPAVDNWRKRITKIVPGVERDTAQISETSVKGRLEAGEMAGDNGLGSYDGQGYIDVDSSRSEEDEGVVFPDIKDLFKDKNGLIARLADESTEDAASVIMDALYKAEQAAEEAARASGALQQAVERVRDFEDWDESISWDDWEYKNKSDLVIEPSSEPDKTAGESGERATSFKADDNVERD